MPFRWSGRTFATSWYWLPVLEVALIVMWVVAPSVSFLGIFANRFIITALFAFAFVGNLFPLRKRTYELDASGVRVRGRPWKNADLPWSAIREIGVPSDPPETAAPLPRALSRFITFRGQDGTLLNLINPGLELPREERARFVEALRADARDHGIPMHEIPWSEFMTWKPRRRT